MVRLTGACALVLLGCGAQLVFCRLLCVAAVLPTRAAMFLNRVFWCFLRLRICVGPGAGVSVPTVLSRQETRGHCPSFRVVVINHMVLFHLPPLLPSSLIPLLPPLSLLSLLSPSSLPPPSLFSPSPLLLSLFLPSPPLSPMGRAPGAGMMREPFFFFFPPPFFVTYFVFQLNTQHTPKSNGGGDVRGRILCKERRVRGSTTLLIICRNARLHRMCTHALRRIYNRKNKEQHKF